MHKDDPYNFVTSYAHRLGMHDHTTTDGIGDLSDIIKSLDTLADYLCFNCARANE